MKKKDQYSIKVFSPRDLLGPADLGAGQMLHPLAVHLFLLLRMLSGFTSQSLPCWKVSNKGDLIYSIS